MKHEVITFDTLLGTCIHSQKPFLFTIIFQDLHTILQMLGNQFCFCCLTFLTQARCGILKKGNIYSSRVTRKERNRVGTKFSEGQLFIFRDRQDSCLPSAARLDSPGDQGKGKVGPRKILFLQDFSFLSG